MQLLKGPGCQPRLLLGIPLQEEGIPLPCLLKGFCSVHSPAVTPRSAGAWPGGRGM